MNYEAAHTEITTRVRRAPPSHIAFRLSSALTRRDFADPLGSWGWAPYPGQGLRLVANRWTSSTVAEYMSGAATRNMMSPA